MKKTKAVILERSGNDYFVLAEDGSFRSVRLNSRKEVGEEVELREGRITWTTWMSVAALFLVIITAAFSWMNHKEPATVALLSVDINPSLELRLDANHLVQGASGLNPDGKTLLEGVSIKGKESGEVLSLLVERAIQLHYLTEEHPWVVLGASPEGTGETIPLSGLVDTVAKVGKEKGLSVNVAAFQLTAGQEQEAKAKGLTPGEYGLWLSAQKAGMSIPEQAVKDSSERAKLLSQKTVQAQVEAGKGTLKLGPSAENTNSNGMGVKVQDGKQQAGKQQAGRQQDVKQQDVNQEDKGTQSEADMQESNKERLQEHDKDTSSSQPGGQRQDNQPGGIPVFKGSPAEESHAKEGVDGQTGSVREQVNHEQDSEEKGGDGRQNSEDRGLPKGFGRQ